MTALTATSATTRSMASSATTARSPSPAHILYGNEGAVKLRAAPGRDIAWGGDGADVFKF